MKTSSAALLAFVALVGAGGCRSEKFDGGRTGPAATPGTSSLLNDSRNEPAAAPGSSGSPLPPNDKPSYGAAVSNDDFTLGQEEKTALLKLARRCVETYVKTGVIPEAQELGGRFPHLNTQRACFVTLRKDGDLRGCIGSLEARRALIDDVRHNAVAAAVSDTRFAPVAASELSKIDYEISVLDQPRILEGVPTEQLPAWLSQHKPGLIIEYRGRRSTFLPSVWEDLPDPNDFLDRLCRKQGSPPGCWRDPSTRLSVYGSIHFGEKDSAR